MTRRFHLPTGSYQAIYRTNAGVPGNPTVLELSNCATGKSDFPNAEFVRISGGNASQNSAGCIVGSKLPGTALGKLLSTLQRTTSPMTPTTLNVTNSISTASAYVKGTSESGLAFRQATDHAKYY